MGPHNGGASSVNLAHFDRGRSMFQLYRTCLLTAFFLLAFGGSMQALADPIWIDVRGADEYAAGHLAEAILIPHDQIAGLISAKVSDKNADIQLYCRTGRRADIARDVLLQMGYTRVTNHGSLENALAVSASKHSAGPLVK